MTKYDRLADSSTKGIASSSVQGTYIGVQEEMPEPSVKLMNTVLMYIGKNTIYQYGAFYRCDGVAWERITQSIVTAPSKVLVSDYSGNVTASDISAVELGYLKGTEGNIQGQFDDIWDELEHKASAVDMTSVLKSITDEAQIREDADALLTNKLGLTDKTVESNYIELKSAINAEVQDRKDADANVITEATGRAEAHAESIIASRDVRLDDLEARDEELTAEDARIDAKVDANIASIEALDKRMTDAEAVGMKSLASAGISIDGDNSIVLRTTDNEETVAESAVDAVRSIALELDPDTRVATISVNGEKATADLSRLGTGSIDSVRVDNATDFHTAIASTKATAGHTVAFIDVTMGIEGEDRTQPLFCILSSAESETEYEWCYLSGAGTVLNNEGSGYAPLARIDAGKTGQFIVYYWAEDMTVIDSASQFVSATILYL